MIKFTCDSDMMSLHALRSFLSGKYASSAQLSELRVHVFWGRGFGRSLEGRGWSEWK